MQFIDGLSQLLERLPKSRQKRLPPWSPGLSVIIPERDGVDMLTEALSSVFKAAAKIDEPCEVIVVINGSCLDDYSNLQETFPQVRWLHSRKPLGFSEAIAFGLRSAKYDWVYLLNNDMTLEENALREVMRWRAAHVFAIASQILFVDTKRRREETGWTDFRFAEGRTEIFDRLPEDSSTVRGHLYAGGGSSLFRRVLLAALVKANPYHPFYWEDADWGLSAWKQGFEVLFCPTSKAWHKHRATVSKFFSRTEIERIFRRNNFLFELRNRLADSTVRQLFIKIRKLDAKTQAEIINIKAALHIAAARIRNSRAAQREICPRYLTRKYYSQPFDASGNKPCVLVVTPYAVFPPSHGGAIRIHNLLKRLGEFYQIVLLSDEENLYTQASVPFLNSLAALHLVGGRLEQNTDQPPRIQRILDHSHSTLRAELRRIAEMYRPRFVQIEYLELAGLIANGKLGLPWFITLHDVLTSSAELTAVDLQERKLIAAYNVCISCSSEDNRLLHGLPNRLIANGAELENYRYAPSQGRNILFMGPFRYQPNFNGIRQFIELAYPQIKAGVPDLSLVILGGNDAQKIANQHACFADPSIRVLNHVNDVRPWLADCALTINPLHDIRGSSIKLIESLAAGRACVSTKDGARGFLDAGFASLFITDELSGFVEPIQHLLVNDAMRRKIECPNSELLRAFSWQSAAEKVQSLYREYEN